MSDGGKGGSTSSSVQIPDWIKGPAERNLARAEQAANIGYMPYYGPSVAALSPQQQSAMGMSNAAAQAFGFGGASDLGVAQPSTFAGGVQGYSSGGLFDQAVNELAVRRPEQVAAYNRLFDPNAIWNNPTQWNAVQSVGANPMDAGGGTGISSMTDAQFGAQMGQGAANAASLAEMGLVSPAVAQAAINSSAQALGMPTYGLGVTQAPAPVSDPFGTSFSGSFSGGWNDGGTGVGVDGGSVGAGGGNAAGGFSFGGW